MLTARMSPALNARKIRSRSSRRGNTRDGGSGHAPCGTQSLGDVAGVRHPVQKKSRERRPLARRKNFVKHGGSESVLVEDGFHLPGVELASDQTDAGKVGLEDGRLAHQAGEIAIVKQDIHRKLEGDVGENAAFTFVEKPAVKPVGRRGKANHLEGGVDLLQSRQQIAVRAGVGGFNKVALIDQNEIAVAEQFGLLWTDWMPATTMGCRG